MGRTADRTMLYMLSVLMIILLSVMILQDRQISDLNHEVMSLRQDISGYEIRTQDVLESYNDVRDTQVTLMQLYEESGKFNK